jgi:hypothetical protein
MTEENKPTPVSAAAGIDKKNEPKTVPLKKPLRYGGTMLVAGTHVVLSDKRRARLAVKGYV